MGLYISRLLMDAQNGEIGLESSTVGKGSKFYIIIPSVKK
jgi:signal transduction histidine kinase